jgi:hypothetical protein
MGNRTTAGPSRGPAGDGSLSTRSTFRSFRHARATARRWLALSAAVAGVVVTSAQPLRADAFWDLSGTGAWNEGNNWSDSSTGGTTGAVPGAADKATFNQSTVNGPTTATLDNNYSIGGLIFNNTGTTALTSDGIATPTLTIGSNGIVINSGAGAVTLGDAIKT